MSPFEQSLAEESKWLANVVDQPFPSDSNAGYRVYVGPSAALPRDDMDRLSPYSPKVIAREAPIRAAIALKEAKLFKTWRSSARYRPF